MTTLQSATSTLLDHYAQAAGASRGIFNDPFGSTVSRSDLEALVTNPDPDIPQELRDAAQFLLDSQASRNFLDVGAGKGGVDGEISREDLQAAMETIASGNHYDELLDTAAGRGGSWNPFVQGQRDGQIGDADLQAALLDPGVPEAVKDTIRMLQLGQASDRAVGDVLEGMSSGDYAAVAALYGSPAFAALSDGDRQLAAEALRDGGDGEAIARDLATLVGDPSFQASTAAQRTARLTEFALLQSPEFQALPPADQRLVREALANRESGDTGLPAAIRSLIEDGEFAGLSAEEQTAVLSQVRNYPDTRSVENLERLVQKDWFQDFDLADTQRAAKMVAFLSQYDAGDRTVIDNTLDQFLAEDAPYRFDFTQTGSAYGSAPGPEFKLNPRYMDDGNGPVDTSNDDTMHMTTHTFAHEVSHLVNDDEVAETFEYFEEEYRGFYVGFVAQHGREPTAAEVIDRVRHLLTSTSGAYDNIRQALEAGGEESDKIVAFMEDLLGRDDLTADNVIDIIDEMTAAADPRLDADAVVPSGDLDN